jgi:hypothetical protein
MIFRYTTELDSDSIHYKLEAWFSPKTNNLVDYVKHCKRISKRLKQKINDIRGEIGYDKYSIVDLDIRPSGIIFNKKSYMSCKILLFPTNGNISEKTFLDIIQKIFEEDEYLSFTPNKKVAT